MNNLWLDIRKYDIRVGDIVKLPGAYDAKDGTSYNDIPMLVDKIFCNSDNRTILCIQCLEGPKTGYLFHIKISDVIKVKD